MKIALVVPGGVDRSGEHRVIPALLALIGRLARRHDVHVFAFAQEPTPARWTLLGAQIHNIGRGHTLLRTLLAIYREHRIARFHIVQAIFSGSCGLAAVIVGKLLRLPSFVHVAGGELVWIPDIRYGGASTRLRRARESLVLRNASAVTAATPMMIESIARFGVRAQRVPLGVDLNVWPINEPVARDKIASVRLIHAASLNRVKDQTTLLLALQRLAERGIDFHIDMVGVDTLNGAIHALARRLGLENKISFHGLRTHRELHVLMTRAHISVMSSRHEAGPLVILEAAIAGVPTVGTEVGHIAEWSPHAALSVPVGDNERLAAAISSLLEDDELRLRIAREAQRRALIEDADYTAKCFEELYSALSAARTE